MNLFLTLPIGASYRDFVVCGVVDRLRARLPDAHLVLLTPAWQQAELRALEVPDHVTVLRHDADPRLRPLARLLLSQRKARRGGGASGRLRGWAETRAHRPPAALLEAFARFPPALVVTTHPMPLYDYDVGIAARRLGVPCVGVVRSWDNIRKGLAAQPARLAVWGPTNAREAVALLGYRPADVTETGSPSFDPYFAAAPAERGAFLESLGFAPTDRVVTLATSGVNHYIPGCDETFLLDALDEWRRAEPALHGVRLVVRLHPNSRMEHFLASARRAGAVFSHSSYLPGLGWYQDRADLEAATNLLRHSDAIVTMGSSWAIEAAIFDTPVVCPFYHPLMPERFMEHTRRRCLDQHFRPIVDEDLAPICWDAAQTRRALVEALENPARYRAARRTLVARYIAFQDAGSAARVADWIAAQAG